MLSYPFLSDVFFRALEASGAASPRQGWLPCHLNDGDNWLPLYRRNQSRGEYVFDFSWAQAYQRHGLAYYPKLVTAVPYTPVAGPRWRGDWSASALWQGIQGRIEEHGASGWHLLFPDQACREQLAELPLVARQACHFRWFNRDYRDFEDYLARFQSRKRKNVRKERRRVADQGVTVIRRCGAQIEPQDWRLFYQCYADTYLKRGQLPYLDEPFFSALASGLNEQLMLVLAFQQGQAVAAALYLFDDRQLYGRYWGALAEVDCLHFELCYYQGIEFAIERRLQVFDPGVQGEHKILRGFEPVLTWSLHHLVEPAFQRAIADFCEQEGDHVRAYQADARTLLPFRSGGL
ncbi:MAG: GNAT family N-acetyltransferase [Alcanivorax sp.]|nr:GNAT family N-acetyltransferase [Alcanivorax sp.]